MEDKRNTEYQMHTGHIQLEQVLPAEIENRSFEIIQDELAAMGKVLDPVQDLLIRRAIILRQILTMRTIWYFPKEPWKQAERTAGGGCDHYGHKYGLVGNQ